MANPSKNPSSPPKESSPAPSVTPSTIPTSKKGRFKMLAQQVPSGLSIASDIISGVAENLENIFVLVGTIAGVETIESERIDDNNKKKKEKESEGVQGDVRGKGKEGVVESSPTPVGLTEETWGVMELRKRFQELVPSVQEPLENLLKRVSDSYNPKKKQSSGVKTPRTARAHKKRKAASSIPVETPPTRGKATRKPSTLARRTRSTRKSRKVQVVEEEESEEEEETDEEQDKMEKFGKRTILKGRLLGDLEGEGMVMLLEKLELQGWKDMVFQMEGRLARAKIMEFMTNCEIKNDRVTGVVKGVTVRFDDKELGEILGVPAEGYNDYKKLKWPSLENLPTSLAITKLFADNETWFIQEGACEQQSESLVQESEAKDAEIERLKKRLAEVETERDALRTELAKEKENNEGILHDMLKLLQVRNQESDPSQP
uniref:Uncharacterized protein n=1 Tax=Nicotiana tabacum TaxID=4097 RepID=A0A1S4ACQ4_TOBAC|nr:PREDICTED: uncharacterized protein LOC107796206 [Nicotiana tabacum]